MKRMALFCISKKEVQNNVIFDEYEKEYNVKNFTNKFVDKGVNKM